MAVKNRIDMRRLRHERVRRKISGTAETPRMCVCKTSKHLYVQFVDDEKSHTLVAASTLEKAFRESKQKANVAGATFLGKMAAERALAATIKRVVFDRGGFPYHGIIKAVADAARAGGLEF